MKRSNHEFTDASGLAVNGGAQVPHRPRRKCLGAQVGGLTFLVGALFFTGQSTRAVNLVSMEYSGGYHVDDDAGNSPSGPEWTPTRSWPYLYVRNSYLCCWPVVVTFPPSGQTYFMQLRGLCPDGVVVRDGSAEDIGIRIDIGIEGLTFAAFSSVTQTRFPNYTYKYSSYQITWQYRTRPDTDPPQWSGWSTFGTSSTVLYLCLAANYVSPRYRSLVDNACKNGGATTEQTATDNTWLAFSGCSTKTWSGTTLYYYRPPTMFATNGLTLYELLNSVKKTAQCEAWQECFLNCLYLHNISAVNAYAFPSRVSYPDDSHLLVKKWSEDNGGNTNQAPYKWLMTLPSPVPEMNTPQGAGGPDFGDLTSEPTLIGQGSVTPSEKMFNYHALVVCGSTYYDPSYGKTYYTENGMESGALYGFVRTLSTYSCRARRASSGGVKFDWSPP